MPSSVTTLNRGCVRTRCFSVIVNADLHDTTGSGCDILMDECVYKERPLQFVLCNLDHVQHRLNNIIFYNIAISTKTLFVGNVVQINFVI